MGASFGWCWWVGEGEQGAESGALCLSSQPRTRCAHPDGQLVRPGAACLPSGWREGSGREQERCCSPPLRCLAVAQPRAAGCSMNAFAHAQCVVELLAGPPQPSPTATLDPTPAHHLPTFQITPPQIHPPGCALQGSRGHRAVQDRGCGAAEQAEELAGTPHHRGVYWRCVRWVGCCECCVGWWGC